MLLFLQVLVDVAAVEAVSGTRFTSGLVEAATVIVPPVLLLAFKAMLGASRLIHFLLEEGFGFRIRFNSICAHSILLAILVLKLLFFLLFRP